jgi:hypothetical protein
MRGYFRWYQSRRTRPLGSETFSGPSLTFSLLSSSFHKILTLILAWFQMANLEWNRGVYPAQPGLPNLLLLILERVGVRDPPEYIYWEYERYGTLRCKVLIFVDRSTLYPDIEPWFISTTGFCFANTYPKAAQKALRRLRVVYRQHLRRTPMGFFPPSRGRGRSWIDRMRGLAREEEDQEDAAEAARPTGQKKQDKR